MDKKYFKYQHIEKIENDDVEDIIIGDVYCFPKIDGTNSHIWYDINGFHYGSRNRELTIDNDNQGFMKWASTQEKLLDLCKSLNAHIFGEWLVPHTLKTYKKDAWNKFYIFDIIRDNKEYMHYDEYSVLLNSLDIDYIPVLRIIKNPSLDNLYRVLQDNNYLIEDGKGIGEGIVIKNYEYNNKYGNKIWAKIVTSDFKEKHRKEMGVSKIKGSSYIEEEIIQKFLTNDIIDKVFANIKNECGWNNTQIPRFLNTVWHDFIIENIWEIIKKFKNPKIDFKILNKILMIEIKKLKKELF